MKGDIVNGVPHGYGKENNSDGTVNEGYWENGKFIS